jgi:hypothetical protein
MVSVVTTGIAGSVCAGVNSRTARTDGVCAKTGDAPEIATARVMVARFLIMSFPSFSSTETAAALGRELCERQGSIWTAEILIG